MLFREGIRVSNSDIYAALREITGKLSALESTVIASKESREDYQERMNGNVEDRFDYFVGALNHLKDEIKSVKERTLIIEGTVGDIISLRNTIVGAGAFLTAFGGGVLWLFSTFAPNWSTKIIGYFSRS